MGGQAYPRPFKMASNDGFNPPMLSIPVTEQINLPAKAIAPYMPGSANDENNVSFTKELHIMLSHVSLL